MILILLFDVFESLIPSASAHQNTFKSIFYSEEKLVWNMYHTGETLISKIAEMLLWFNNVPLFYYIFTHFKMWKSLNTCLSIIVTLWYRIKIKIKIPNMFVTKLDFEAPFLMFRSNCMRYIKSNNCFRHFKWINK